VSQFGGHSFAANPSAEPGAVAPWTAKRSARLNMKIRARLDTNRPDTAGHVYYRNMLETTSDPEIKALARVFVEEEAGHVAELRKWIAVIVETPLALARLPSSGCLPTRRHSAPRGPRRNCSRPTASQPNLNRTP